MSNSHKPALHNTRITEILAVICISLLLLVSIYSKADEANPAWTDLTDKQQLVLKRIAPRWEQLSLQQKQKLMRRADQFIQMNPEQRERFARRAERWRSFTPAKRKAMLREYRRFKSLPPAKRAALKKRYRQFQSMPPERKRMLRERWQNQHRKPGKILGERDFQQSNVTPDRLEEVQETVTNLNERPPADIAPAQPVDQQIRD